MDPDVTLEELRSLIASWVDDPSTSEVTDLLDEIASRFEALDQWVAKGRYLPLAWRAGVRHAPAPGYPCGTVGCSGTALWIPMSEGNRGMRTYRCHDCCDRIDNAYAKAVAE